MKSKYFRILGVVTVVAMLAGMLSVIPAFGMTTPSVTLTGVAGGTKYVTDHLNKYYISFQTGAAVGAGGRVNVTFPAKTNFDTFPYGSVATNGGDIEIDAGVTDTYITFTSTAAGEQLTMANAALWAEYPAPTGKYVGGVLTFTAAGQSVILYCATDGPISTSWWRSNGNPTASFSGVKSLEVTMEATASLGGGPIAANTQASYLFVGAYPAAITVSIGVPSAYLGTGSVCAITFGANVGVRNPGTAGTYNIYVGTILGTTTIEATTKSADYVIVNPTFNPFPGLIKVFNKDGTQIWQAQGNDQLGVVLATKVADNYTVELGAGWYIETVDMVLAADDVTIKGTGAVGDVVVQGQLEIDGDGAILKGFTMRSYVAGATTLEIYGDDILVDGCTFSRYFDNTVTTQTNTVPQTFVYIDNDHEVGTGKITNCTFDSTLSSANGDHCIIVDYAGWSSGDEDPEFYITKNKFTLDGSATTYTTDVAIITGAYDVYIEENEFAIQSGTGGWGVYCYDDGWTEIYKNKFSGLTEALEVDYAGGLFIYNTVDKCGAVEIATADAVAAVAVWDTDYFIISGNTFTNSPDWTIYGDDCDFSIVGNTFTTNAKGIYNEAGCELDATRNWWGAATGPAAGLNGDRVDDGHPLGAAPTAVYYEMDTTKIDGRDVTPAVPVVVNLDYESVFAPDDTAYMVGAMTFAANPLTAAIPSNLTGPKYFDVFVVEPPQALFLASLGIQIRFYGTVKASTEVWVYSGDAGEWTRCSLQTRNIASGFVTVNVTADTVPDIDGLDGTVFVMVEAPLAAPGGTTITAISPAMGASNVPINTTFSWPEVTGAVSYEWQLAADTGQTTDKFYLKDDVQGPTINAVKPTEDLKYSTTYWWRVRAKDSAGVAGAWTTAFFTTAAAPVVVEPTPPVVIQENPPPEITLTVPPAEVTKVEPIPAYLLWAVIAVGAVLVIAVIVLIVRTRRIS
jgi:Right handed beta helix region